MKNAYTFNTKIAIEIPSEFFRFLHGVDLKLFDNFCVKYNRIVYLPLVDLHSLILSGFSAESTLELLKMIRSKQSAELPTKQTWNEYIHKIKL